MGCDIGEASGEREGESFIAMVWAGQGDVCEIGSSSGCCGVYLRRREVVGTACLTGLGRYHGRWMWTRRWVGGLPLWEAVIDGGQAYKQGGCYKTEGDGRGLIGVC